MLHEIMQDCLLDWTSGSVKWDERDMETKIEKEVTRGLGDLLRLNISVEQAKKELKERSIGLKAFQQRYISNVPKVGVFAWSAEYTGNYLLHMQMRA